MFQDFLEGSFDSFETNISKDAEGYYIAEAMGIKARAVDQEQAVNDLNQALSSAMERGELTPEMMNN